jgi:hypothetical protein
MTVTRKGPNLANQKCHSPLSIWNHELSGKPLLKRKIGRESEIFAIKCFSFFTRVLKGKYNSGHFGHILSLKIF